MLSATYFLSTAIVAILKLIVMVIWAWWTLDSKVALTCLRHIVIPRDSTPFGQHQESRSLGRSNTGPLGFTGSPSLHACSESSMTNLWQIWLTEKTKRLLCACSESDLPRGRKSLCWSERAWSLGTRVTWKSITNIPNFEMLSSDRVNWTYV